jgi:hypothetical protein
MAENDRLNPLSLPSGRDRIPHRSEHLVERKKIYEQLHPETRQGSCGRSR